MSAYTTIYPVWSSPGSGAGSQVGSWVLTWFWFSGWVLGSHVVLVLRLGLGFSPGSGSQVGSWVLTWFWFSGWVLGSQVGSWVLTWFWFSGWVLGSGRPPVWSSPGSGSGSQVGSWVLAARSGPGGSFCDVMVVLVLCEAARGRRRACHFLSHYLHTETLFKRTK